MGEGEKGSRWTPNPRDWESFLELRCITIFIIELIVEIIEICPGSSTRKAPTSPCLDTSGQWFQ